MLNTPSLLREDSKASRSCGWPEKTEDSRWNCNWQLGARRAATRRETVLLPG
jgi:hypothetical protein